MKIDKRLRDSYSDQLELYTLLKEEVDGLRASLDAGWHYESRLKSEESFALKIEAGRFTGDLELDDFLGCSIVVRRAGEIDRAVSLIGTSFDIVNRRPESDTRTKRRPYNFIFDDLRVYTRLRSQDYLPPSRYAGLIFEVQIKTYLQHAWAIATHDLIYKTDAVDWAKARIAYQVRAMLEHAELSIQEVEQLSKSVLVAKESAELRTVVDAIDLVRTHWPKEQLPADLRRLAENTLKALDVLGISLVELAQALEAEKHEGRGVLLQNLSPYGVIIQTIAARFSDRLQKVRRRGRPRIPASSQVEFPPAVSKAASSVFQLI